MLILMSVCLLADPTSCREERIGFSFEEASPFACVVHSQGAIASWQKDHPEWRVSEWRCVTRRAAPHRI